MVSWKNSKKGSTGGQRMRDLLFVYFLVYIARYQWGLGATRKKRLKQANVRRTKVRRWYFLVGEFESCPVKQQNEANEGLSLAHAAAPL